MNQLKRRTKYQYGTLTLEPRARGPNVWSYRYFEVVNGRKRRRKTIVGTVEEYRTQAVAERACEHIRLTANAEMLNQGRPSMGALIDRYAEQVLRPCLDLPVGGVQGGGARISFHCAKSYQSVLNKWVCPRWESYRVRDFDRPALRAAIEDWLQSLWRSQKNPEAGIPRFLPALALRNVDTSPAGVRR